MALRSATLILCLVSAGSAALAQAPGRLAAEFKLEEVASLSALDPSQLKPNVISFSDHRKSELADPGSGLLKFEDWARAKPVQRQFLSLYPAYAEPTINVTVNGITKPYKEKLHVYVAEARFEINKPANAVDLSRYASIGFVERMDPAIKHRAITQADLASLKDPELVHERHPDRAWCDPQPNVVCLQSRYQLEGKLPAGVKLANKLKEGGTKISDFFDFQSELRRVPDAQLDQAGIQKLTGVNAPVSGVLEQSIFHVNQVMQFAKFLAAFQPHPNDPNKTVVSAFMVLAVETDVLEKRKEYESVPVLRNMVPAQVLVGNSSFNTGSSISAGLPHYARNSIKAIAGLLSRD